MTENEIVEKIILHKEVYKAYKKPIPIYRITQNELNILESKMLEYFPQMKKLLENKKTLQFNGVILEIVHDNNRGIVDDLLSIKT